MTLTPQILGPDGVLRETFVFTTTIPERIFTGTVDETTVDMQISVRGGPFTSNPDLVVFEGTSFTVPNPAVFPDGLDLQAGSNDILLRAVSFSGAVSNSAVVQANLVQESDVVLAVDPPSNIKVERFNAEVEITVEKPDNDNIIGFNFYASQFSGGGATGYTRVNLSPVIDSFIQEEVTVLRQVDSDANIATTLAGQPAADPLFLQIKQTQTRGGDVIEKLEDVSLTDELAEAITYDEQANLLQSDFTSVSEVPETTARIRTSVTVESVRQVEYIRFKHNRNNGPSSLPPTVPIGAFAATPISEPLYYVVTAITFDATTNTELESPFSIEVFGNPVTISLNLGAFPTVTRSDITNRLISSVLRTNPQLALQPGAVIRDTVIDPVAAESEKVRFVVDFLHRSQSFDTLVRVDGVGASGNPTPVDSSAYKLALKKAFGITSNQTQALIDHSFEQLASNVGVTRKPGIRARGLGTFFTSRRPSATIPIPLGTRISSGGVFFVSTEEASIPVENAASFFNPSTGLFSVDVPIRAENPGSSGNLAAGQINTVITNTTGSLAVTNPGRTFGGREVETNVQLAERSKNALASVDSGTEAGYRQTLANLPGVLESFIVTPGNDLMQRDFDPDYLKHAGGKVDAYIRGESLATVSDTFAFRFERKFNVQFVPVGNILDLRFQAIDSDLSADNPLAEMLNFPNASLGLRNASTGVEFNLSNAVVENFKTIKLDTTQPQPTVTFGDIVLGDYRLVASRRFVLPRQPVREIQSVTGVVTGSLEEDAYGLFRLDDPLKDGKSVEAQSAIEIFQVNGAPTGEKIGVLNEEHVIIGEFPEFLNNLGADSFTIRVFNLDRTVEYRGPFDPSGVSDYTILPGNETTAVSIKRVLGRGISSGQRLSIDYFHDENFTVSYVVNLAVIAAQEDVSNSKHITADVLVKETVAVPVDITATIVKRAGVPTSVVDRRVRSNLAQFFSNSPLGSSIRQSDVVSVLKNTEGVDFVEVPVVKLARSVDACVVRELLASSQSGDSTFIRGSDFAPISTETVLVWLLDEELNSATTTGGGPETEFRGVFQDDTPLELQIVDPLSLGTQPGKAFIIGAEGLSIPGFSDDATLTLAFPTAGNLEIEEERLRRTSNRVLISLPVGDSPTNYVYRVTYVVGPTNAGAKNLNAFDIEFFETGNFNFTYTEIS